MRKRTSSALVAAGALLFCGAALGDIFLWTGAGDDLWSNGENWNLEVCENEPCPPHGWPDGPSDDAIISMTSNVEIVIPTVAIDELSISRNAEADLNLTFTPVGVGNVLTADSVRIKNSQGYRMTITVTDSGQLITG